MVRHNFQLQNFAGVLLAHFVHDLSQPFIDRARITRNWRIPYQLIAAREHRATILRAPYDVIVAPVHDISTRFYCIHSDSIWQIVV